MSGGGGDSTTTTEPWEAQQPYLEDIFGEASNLYSMGIGQQYYPGEMVAPFSAPTQQGFDALLARGGGTPEQAALGSYLGQSMTNSGADSLGATAEGDFLGSNPYLDDLYDTSAAKITDSFNEEIMPGLNATFGDASRTGSGIHQLYASDAAGEAQDSLAALAADIYAPAYESERDRMVESGGMLADQASLSASMIPSLDTMQRTNIQDVLNVGAGLEDQTQRLIDADVNKFNFGQTAPWDALAQYSDTIYGLPGTYGETDVDGAEGSRVAGGVGGAMAGAGLAGSVAALNPYMWPLTIGGGIYGALS